MEISNSVLEHLRHVAALPDLAATRYELESEIGRGGMGVVYRALDRQLDRHVALKVLDVPLAGEAQLIARLEHPSVVPIYETGVLPDGRCFYAMKLVSGARLDAYAAGQHTMSERLRVIRRIGEALAYAHSRGVIHRDLKPQNVMVGEFGEVYVMDWGVEAVAGTPAFRAPDASLDQLSDLYSLGGLLRFLVPASLSPAVAAIAAKAMSADPSGRYPTVTAFLADVDRFEQGLAVNAWSEPLWHRLQRFSSRNAVLLWLLAAYTLVKFLLFFLRKF
ncbi:MAG TPA: serine/threonine-protein kinase [Candidatus Dormibacteraeota bacterium]|nr:serine/threonine-protein kinase [Candidatus Dormibacteraeota bacterium]